MDNLTWILVANSSTARLFHTHKAKLFSQSPDPEALTFINEFSHAKSRKKDQDLVTDKQGNFGTGTFVEATDPKQYEAEVFSRELTNTLSNDFNQHHFHELILVAPPAFMGLLNKNLSDELNKLISLTIEKDYTDKNPRELVTHLANFL